MSTVILDPQPVEIQALIERRKRLGQDRRDEMWKGVLHMSPSPSRRHSELVARLLVLIDPLARAAGLTPSADFNLGDSKDDFRVPDGGLHRPGGPDMWLPTAALAVEIVSPGDESWEKLPFYAAHHVQELLIVDPATRKIDWLGLDEQTGEYRAMERSGLIDLGVSDLARRIDWPPAE